MAISKNKILLRDASLLKDMYKEITEPCSCGSYWGCESHDYDDYYRDYYGYDSDSCPGCGIECSCCCQCGEYEYYYEEDIFGNPIRTCIPSGKEYLRKKKIDSLLVVADNGPITNIHAQLLKVGLLD